MEQLREKVALEVSAVLTDESGCSGAPYEFEGALYQDYDDTVPLTRIANKILDIPEIRDALAEKRINAMSPAQFGEKLLAPDMSNYDNPRKQDRRYKRPAADG